MNYSIPNRPKKIVYRDTTEMWVDRLNGRLYFLDRFFGVVFDGIIEDASDALNDIEARTIKRLEGIHYGTLD